MPPAKPAATRRRVNLTIAEDVIEAAKALNLNASEAAETGLRRAIAAKQAEAWRRDNRVAIGAHNARIEKSGVLLNPDWAADG